MASQIYAGIAAAMVDCFNVTGQVFTWQGKDYGCSLNTDSATIVTSKALFSGAIPKPGDVITVSGKKRQVLFIDNATTVLVPGGYVEPNAPYADDTATPAFAIHYGVFIRG